jgi:uncharacterized protein
VKACAGIALPSSALTSRGLAFDRRFMLVNAEGLLITQREHPILATVWTDVVGEELRLSSIDMDEIILPLEPVYGTTMRVQVWDDSVDALLISDEADHAFSMLLGEVCHLVYMPDTTLRQTSLNHSNVGDIVSFADGYPLLLTNVATLDDLNTRIIANGGHKIPMTRFRPNLVMSGGDAYADDRLGEIKIGDAIFRAAKPCARCEVTTIDQASGERLMPEPLQTLASYRDTENGPTFGMNLIPRNNAMLRVGDLIEFL